MSRRNRWQPRSITNSSRQTEIRATAACWSITSVHAGHSVLPISWAQTPIKEWHFNKMVHFNPELHIPSCCSGCSQTALTDEATTASTWLINTLQWCSGSLRARPLHLYAQYLVLFVCSAPAEHLACCLNPNTEGWIQTSVHVVNEQGWTSRYI